MANRLYAVLIALSLLLTACGGSSSSSDTASGTSSGNGTILQQAPLLPQPVYVGEQNASVINETDASLITLDFFWASYLSRNLSGSAYNAIPAGEQTVNTVENGPVSGSATVVGRQESFDSAWYQISYSNYAFKDSASQAVVTENGTVVILVNPPTTGESSPVYSIGFDKYEVAEAGSDALLQGYVTAVGEPDPTAILANLVVTNVQTGNAFYLSGINQAIGSNGIMYTGRFYDSTAGYVQINTSIAIPGPACVLADPNNPALCYPGSAGAVPSGNLTFSGAGPTVLHVSALTNNYLFLGLDLDGNGTIDEGTRFDESTGTIDEGQHHGVVSTIPVAHILQTNTAQAGASLQLDGSFSYIPGGWVTYSWQLLQAPPGSQVTFQTSKSQEAEFTPDIVGNYLVELTVSSNGLTSSDLLQVVAQSGGSNNSESAPSEFTLPASATGAIGQAMFLDGAASPSSPPFFETPPEWVMNAPPGSQASLDASQSLFPTFTPDVRGYYEVAANTSITFSAMDLNRMVVAVGARTYLSPAVPFNGIAQFSYGLACGIFDHSGRPGIAMVAISPNATSFDTTVWLWLRNAINAYAYQAPAYLNDNQASNPYINNGIVTQDFNGDGQSDIVVADLTGATAYISQATNGYLADTLALPLGVDDVGIATGVLDDSNSQGSKAVAVIGSNQTGQSVYIYKWNGSGFGQAVVDINGVPANSGSPLFALGDVTGDGKADAVFCLNTAANAELAVEPGDGLGDFGAATYYSLPGASCGALKISDLTGNGRQDIVVADGNHLNIFMQTTSGTLLAQPTLQMASATTSMTVADLNGDGYQDIAVLQCSSTACVEVGIYWGSSSGPSGTEFLEDVIGMEDVIGNNPVVNGQIASCDFNGDGIPDLAINDSGTVYVMYGEPVD